MKDVVKKEVIEENDIFIKLLTKICLDLGIDNYEIEIEDFFKNKEKEM